MSVSLSVLSVYLCLSMASSTNRHPPPYHQPGPHKPCIGEGGVSGSVRLVCLFKNRGKFGARPFPLPGT